MLIHAILLDAAMPAAHVLARLARYGIWNDPKQADAKEWIEQKAARAKVPFDAMAAKLAEPTPARFGAAIRRQYYQSILWYAKPVREVLKACESASRDIPLIDALGLHEPDSRPTLALTPSAKYQSDGVVLQDGLPIAVHLLQSNEAAAFTEWDRSTVGSAASSGTTRGSGSSDPKAAAPTMIKAFPTIEAPDQVPAKKLFHVTVGLGSTQQIGTTGGQVTITAPAGQQTIDVTVELIANGVDAPSGWSRPLTVSVADPFSAKATFDLIGREPLAAERVSLTTLEVRYVCDGTICGAASRPLVIGPSSGNTPDTPGNYGTHWLAQPPAASEVDLTPDPLAADLTIELAKPDRNQAEGRYVCRLYSRHKLTTPLGPWDVDFGHDAKTFARTIIQGVREYSGGELLSSFLESVGGLVSEKLPSDVFAAIREVAAISQPDPPAVLFVSAEPFVPWELAFFDAPLTTTHPPFLGAQTLLGRWFRDTKTASAPIAPGSSSARLEKPPQNPPAAIPVKHMAVMAGKYKPTSGLRALPAADAEVDALETSHKAVKLAASQGALRQLLQAKLEQNAVELGPAGAVHFAGHGQFEPTEPDSSVLYLSDGKPLSSLLFRSARYGGEQQPFIFFNACMIGIGGEVLGDMGGFPGNSLRGGFGGVLGALWEVDDTVASDIALEFWRRVLPPAGGSGEPVAAVLRDMRANYQPDAAVPISTYIAYTYYGHPRLTLRRQP